MWLASSIACVIFRSSLNLFDRVLFGSRALRFFYLYLASSLLSLSIGFGALVVLGKKLPILETFLSPSCLLLAIAVHLVGISFSYAFRHNEVRHVILRAKLPEIILPLFIFLPFLGLGNSNQSFEYATLAPLLLSWLALVPLLTKGDLRRSLFDKTSLYVGGSLLLQMAVSSFVALDRTGFDAALSLTLAVLMWRSLLTLPLAYLNSRQTTEFTPQQATNKLALLVFARSLMALLTQLTFSWAILEGNPIIIWPIMNMTPLVSSLASQFILEEKLHYREFISLACFFFSACAPWIL